MEMTLLPLLLPIHLLSKLFYLLYFRSKALLYYVKQLHYLTLNKQKGLLNEFTYCQR